MVARSIPKGAAPDVADGVAAIRDETFVALLGVVGAIIWLWLIVKLVRPDDVWPGWGLPLVLIALLIGCNAVRPRWPRLGAAIFVGSLLVGPMVLLLGEGSRSIAAFLFVLPVLIAGSLRGTRGAILTALLASAVILVGARRAGTLLDPATVLGSLVLLWLTALASWATTRNLLIALHWAEANREQAARNLSEARDYQARLSAALRQLEEANYRLERANYALTWAQAEADEARRLKAQFAAHVSHELRTPINLVVGFADLMLHHPETYGNTPLPQPYLTDLASLHRSARHLRELIDDILDLSQVETGEMPVLREPTDLAALINEAVATARQLLERKGLALHVDVASDVPVLSLDRLRIRQVLLNLLNNAARFTERGSVALRAYRQAGREGARVVVEVIDTGVGIAPSDIGALFKPFHQLASSPTRGRGGTGLGLVISKRFVELHGGQIWVASEGVPGRGSTFAFSLPIEPSEPVPEAKDGAASDPRPHRWELVGDPPAPTVVVHDDDPAIVSLFQRHLRGYQVVGAPTPDRALALAAQRSAQAIVTEVPSPEEQPAWLRRWLGASDRARLPVIGCPMPSGRRLTHALGLVDYLVNPVTREALLASVETIAPEARTILVVDDEPRLVRLFCRMLGATPRGYHLLRAYDGAQALAIAREAHPDLVLLDLLMPQIDGLTVLEKLRQDPALATTPVIAVSARGAVEAITPSSNRSLVLLSDRPLSVSRLLGLTQTILDALPPTGAAPSIGREPPGVAVGSAAYG